MGIEVRGMVALFEVFDMPTSIAFYRDLLGFTVHADDGKPLPNNDWVWLVRDDVQLMLNTAYESDKRPVMRDANRSAAHRDVCLYLGCPDVDGAYRYLSERGLELKPPKVAPTG